MKIFKKILIILVVLLLSSCSMNKKEEDIIEEPEVPKEEVIIVEPSNEIDNQITEDLIENSTWIFEGNGEYSRTINNKKIKTEGANAIVSPEFATYGGNVYHLSFDIVSKENTNVNVIIYDGQQEYVNQNFDVNNNSVKYTFDFSCDYTSYNTKIKFNFIDTNEYSINNLSITSDTYKTTAKINQEGYLTNLEKKVVFFSNQGDFFTLYDLNNNPIQSFSLSEPKLNKDSNEYLQEGFFGDFVEKGTYYLKSELGSYSRIFTIDDNIYDELLDDALHFIYTQRCGQYIEDSQVFHDACHTQPTKVYTTLAEMYIDTIGGWHDAGDYGRYVQTANKTIADLLFAYLYASGDEDTLNEARYGIEWALKLQKDDGSVYNKITTEVFSDAVLPEYDSRTMFAMRPWTLTTASFAGVAGLAYEIYKNTDIEFAERCLNAHKKAIDYLSGVKEMQQELNPDYFATGEYRDPNENDERLFAYAVAYYISRDEKDLNLCKEVIDEGLKSDNRNYNCRLYAEITLLKCLNKNDPMYRKVYDSLVDECNAISDMVESKLYSYTYDDYQWGSNSHLCDACSKLVFGFLISGDMRYLDCASKAIDYIMGINCFDMCFIYGYGYKYPNTIHHRVANLRGTTIKGALVGGVDQYLSDGPARNYLTEDTPDARRFVDLSDSYTNIEPAVYYNSSLVLALQLLCGINNLQR